MMILTGRLKSNIPKNHEAIMKAIWPESVHTQINFRRIHVLLETFLDRNVSRHEETRSRSTKLRYLKLNKLPL